MIVKMTILRLIGSSDVKEKIGVARPEGPSLRGFRYPVILVSPVEQSSQNNWCIDLEHVWYFSTKGP